MLSVISRFGVDDVTRAAPRMASMPPSPRTDKGPGGPRTSSWCWTSPGDAVRYGPVRIAGGPVGATAGDRVSRDGGRPLPELTTRTEPADAVVIEPGTIAPGRARGAAPLRREGPAKLTGAAKYADDLVFPGAWYGINFGASTIKWALAWLHAPRTDSADSAATAAPALAIVRSEARIRMVRHASTASRPGLRGRRANPGSCGALTQPWRAAPRSSGSRNSGPDPCWRARAPRGCHLGTAQMLRRVTTEFAS